MKKEIRKINKEGTQVQITIADERWYLEEDDGGNITAFPSVTWIASHYPKGIAFYKWLASKGWDEAETIKESAGDKGYQTHVLITELLNGQTVKIDEKAPVSDGEEKEIGLEVYENLLSFARWYDLVKPRVLENEVTVFNRQEGYAGTVDLVCVVEEEIKKGYFKMEAGTWLIDFKTSQNIWPQHELQISAYNPAIARNIDHFGILQLGYRRNKAKYKLTKVEDQYDLFLATKKIWEKETKGQDVFVADYPTKLDLGIKAKLPKQNQKRRIDDRRNI